QQNGDSTPQQTNKAGVVNQGLTADVTSQGLTTTDSAGDNNPSTGTNSTTTDTASAKDVQIEAGNPDLTPLEVLRTPDFYLLWVALAVNHYGYIIKNNYYKEFGQLRISNDHFLTTTGTLATVGVALARLLWGLATDWLGTKLTLLVFMASTSVTTSFWYFSLQHSAALYMLWVCLVSAIFTGAFILLPLAALSSFGEKHYASNYGLILSAQIVVNLISPPIIRQILLQFGWFWLFFSIAAVNVIGKKSCEMQLILSS
ncbi:oxalate:formate antiporter, partial [Aplysia californica]|uniref:Oxalate:formate antiporter n=1 Tax=Aplysia californica TaxID=6500 RepID=A0ABM1A230_APLCA